MDTKLGVFSSFDEAVVLITLDQRDVKVLDATEQSYRLLQIEKGTINKIADFIKSSEIIITKCYEAIKYNEKLTFIDKLSNSDLWLEVKISPSNTKDSLLIFLTPVNEKIESINVLKKSELKHRLLFTNANDAIIILKNLQIIDCNSKTLKMFGCNYIGEISGKQLYHFMPEKQPDGSDSILKYHYLIQEASKEINHFFYWKHARLNGTQFDTEVSLSGFQLENEEHYVQIIIRDITRRIETENKRLISEKNYKELVELMPDAIVVETNNKITFVNPVASKIFETKEKNLLNSSISDFFDSKDNLKIKQLVIDTKQNENSRFPLELKLKGIDKYVEIQCISIEDEKQFTIKFVVHDITSKKLQELALIRADKAEQANFELQNEIKERIKAEENLLLAQLELKQNIKQKDVLLKEVHHRVKNNLQIINSMLKLQANHINDQETVFQLNECQDRIKSMSYIHESLYQTNDIELIDFSTYIPKLVNSLMHTYGKSHQQVKIVYDLDLVELNIDNSIPCGLIINELVSNVFKYGIPEKSKGILTFILKCKNNEVLLSISDNGQGMPPNFDINNSNSLGLQLVNALINQLEGEVKISNQNGLSYQITFPV